MLRSFEWRTILELSRDPVGVQEVLDKLDVHSINEKTFQLPSRLIAKTYLFRTIFNRGKGYAFTVDPDFMHVSTSVEYWDKVGVAFYTKYKGIDDCHNQWKDELEATGRIQGPLGRHWQIPLLNSFGKLNWNVFTNYPVQGTGADVMLIARLSADRRLKEAGIPFKWRLTVHDSLVIDTYSKYLPQVAAIFDSVFADVPKNIKKLFDYDWLVPMACETKYGPNMLKMTKYHLDKPL